MSADFSEFTQYEDLTPIKQDDGPHPVVAINYNQDFVVVHDYFRAILQKNEISQRGLDISTKVIRLNSANYTAWQYRRECIFQLNCNLYDELAFSKEIALKSPKNYQLWWHRRLLIEGIFKNSQNQSNKKSDANSQQNENTDTNTSTDSKTNDSEVDYSTGYDLTLEKELIRGILSEDGKNYHGWSHLHWLLRAYGDTGLLDDELEYCDKLLEKDIRNNSAWNHRHFIVKTTLFFTFAVCKKEIEYCHTKLLYLANNDSIWYYYSDITLKQLRNAILLEEECKNDKRIFITKWVEWKKNEIDFIKNLLEKHPYCGRGMLYYVDLLNDSNSECIEKEDFDTAIQLLTVLGDKIDRVRFNYYQYLIENIEKRKEKMSSD